MDSLSKAERSRLMGRIRSRGNQSTEFKLIEIFREQGVAGWRRNQPLEGKPDFVFPKAKLAVFVDGCFWHGCPVHGRIPKGNAAFWREKIERNQRRDRQVNRRLRAKGWHVMRIWEHALALKQRNRLLARFSPSLVNNLHV